ncbi:MAG: hypothetical protein ACYST0_13685 [Planctomycetota bacterium]|jgi:hypothetical protein
MLGEFGERAGRAVQPMAKILTHKTEEPVLLAVIDALLHMGRPAKKAEYHLGKLTRSKKVTPAVKKAAAIALEMLKELK